MAMEMDSVRLKMLLPYISGSDLLLAGQDNCVVGLRYDDANMFAPIIMLLEHGISFSAVKEAASGFGVPVLMNEILVKNLITYGKLGDVIPEQCCREIAAIMARNSRKPFNTNQNDANKNPAIQKIKSRLPRPIRMELGETLKEFLGELSILEEGALRIRKQLSLLLGYTFPSIVITANCALKGGEYRVLFKGIEAGRGSIDLGWYNTVDLGLDPYQIRFAAEQVAAALVNHLDELVQKRTPELLGRDEVQALLDRAEKKYPVVTGEVKSFLSLGSIRDILRGLLSEHVSIRHILVILETLADWSNFGPTPNDVIIEQIRQSLKRQICMDYADDKQTLRVLTLDTKLEEDFSDRAMFPDRGLSSAISQDTSADDWLDAFSPAIRRMEEKGLKPVVLCSPVARSWVKEFTRAKFPNLAVLSYVEIPSDIRVEPVGEIALEDRRLGS